jgi:co-chaperonin GroES (HSP10)
MSTLEQINAFNPEKHILLNDRVLLKIESVSDKINGIIVPRDALKKHQTLVVKGEVISWSKGAFKDYEDKPEKGDYLWFKSYSGNILFNDGVTERYRHIHISEITGFERKE